MAAPLFFGDSVYSFALDRTTLTFDASNVGSVSYLLELWSADGALTTQLPGLIGPVEIQRVDPSAVVPQPCAVEKIGDGEGMCFAFCDEHMVTAAPNPPLPAERICFFPEAPMLSTAEIASFEWKAASLPSLTFTGVTVRTRVDDSDSGFSIESGAWAPEPGGWRTGSLSAPAGTGASRVRFTPDLPVRGDYDVRVRWVPNVTRATDAKYTVRTTSGDETVPVDQTTAGTTWTSLGVFELDPADAMIELSDDANGSVSADAIEVNLVAAPVPIHEDDIIVADPARQQIVVVDPTTGSQQRLLDKLAQSVTTRSNVFAVWITVGSFEVESGNDSGSSILLPAGELGDPVDITRASPHRSFYILDRSLRHRCGRRRLHRDRPRRGRAGARDTGADAHRKRCRRQPSRRRELWYDRHRPRSRHRNPHAHRPHDRRADPALRGRSPRGAGGPHAGARAEPRTVARRRLGGSRADRSAEAKQIESIYRRGFSPKE